MPARTARPCPRRVPELLAALPEVNGIEPFRNYTITATDAAQIGVIPEKLPDQGKLKALPYTSLLELVAERFHSEQDFLRRLNPGHNLSTLKADDTLRVPNVSDPLDVTKLAQEGRFLPVRKEFEPRIVKVDTKEKMLDVFEDGHILASFPITPGSTTLPAPIGTWKILSIASMPYFRYDDMMLNHGIRSENFVQLPPRTQQSGGRDVDGLEQKRHRPARHEQPGNHWTRREPRVHPAGELGRREAQYPSDSGCDRKDRVKFVSGIMNIGVRLLSAFVCLLAVGNSSAASAGKSLVSPDEKWITVPRGFMASHVVRPAGSRDQIFRAIVDVPPSATAKDAHPNITRASGDDAVDATALDYVKTLLRNGKTLSQQNQRAVLTFQLILHPYLAMLPAPQERPTSLKPNDTISGMMALDCRAFVSVKQTAPSKHNWYEYWTPKPAYPYHSRQKWENGECDIRITYPPDGGRPKEVAILKSSGHQVLDANSIFYVLGHWYAPNSPPQQVVKKEVEYRLE